MEAHKSDDDFLERILDEQESEWLGYDVMTIEEFKASCDMFMFVNSDGTGYYANMDGDGQLTKSNLTVDCREIRKGNIDARFSHVVWYNK